MSLAGRRVLVTGAGGFIGSHLVERLVGVGTRVRAFVHYNSARTCGWLDGSPVRGDVEILAGDVRDPDSLREVVRDIEVVYHLAALIAIPYSYRTPLSFLRTNAEGTLNVLQASREAGVAIVVHTSTSEVYGTARAIPITEEHPLYAQSPYAASKIAADKIAEAFHRSYDVVVVTVRPFNAYGPRQSARAIIPTIITQALAAPQIRLGRLDPTRDFTYVSDTVDGFIRASESPSAGGQVVNVGSGREISVGELARQVLKALGRELPIVGDNARVRPAASEVMRLCADRQRAEALLGWRPTVNLEIGLARTIDWIQANLHRYRPEEYAT